MDQKTNTHSSSLNSVQFPPFTYRFRMVENTKYYPAGADPGFPVGGGPDPMGAPTYDFAKISIKLHEIEKILGHRGDRRRGAPDPPMSRIQ